MPTVSLDFQFSSSIDRVWLALTDSKKLAKWVMNNNFKPVVGHKFQFWTEPNKWWDGVVDSEVLVVDEPNTLSYTWITDGENTIVTWTLKEVDGNTHLSLVHTGFENEGHAYNGAKLGWIKMGNQLEKMLAEL
ncbi:SRPBCC family protein [Shimazuella alba]|uniref:SRPBCC domain-containing protein n=1 Tax=Shimazuella alba TaxID=2690964 RepID=A0A6I4VUS6_9BACL|nr:SRPBCC domain-containing protein [Shimazuella alba]MXQ53935.1 SRPBCC domain-containing protein [Shimazuella alba]